MTRPAPLSGRAVLDHAAELFSITPRQLTGECRSAPFCKARWAVMLALHRQGWSYPRIAARVGKSDHTTAIHGVRRALEIEASDRAFAAKVAAIEARANPPKPAPRAFPFRDHRTAAEVMAEMPGAGG